MISYSIFVNFMDTIKCPQNLKAVDFLNNQV